MEGNAKVVHVPERQRYELHLGERVVGYATAVPRENLIVLPHVEVEPEFEGQGLGSKLVKGVLDDVRARGLRVVPICPFVGAYLRRHPEYADLAG
jgi:predicted GNAT family acetyltransferase